MKTYTLITDSVTAIQWNPFCPADIDKVVQACQGGNFLFMVSHAGRFLVSEEGKPQIAAEPGDWILFDGPRRPGPPRVMTDSVFRTTYMETPGKQEGGTTTTAPTLPPLPSDTDSPPQEEDSLPSPKPSSESPSSEQESPEETDSGSDQCGDIPFSNFTEKQMEEGDYLHDQARDEPREAD